MDANAFVDKAIQDLKVRPPCVNTQVLLNDFWIVADRLDQNQLLTLLYASLKHTQQYLKTSTAGKIEDDCRANIHAFIDAILTLVDLEPIISQVPLPKRERGGDLELL